MPGESERDRLAELVVAKYGPVSKETVRRLAKDAGVHYTSLARYLLYTREQKRTSQLRTATLSAVAVRLESTLEWIRDGQGSKQLGLWPILVSTTAETRAVSPAELLSAVLAQIAALPEDVQIRASRAAVAAALEVAVSEGRPLNDQAYRCLLHLDAMRRAKARIAV
jgi:hypothetical protein